MVQPFLDVSAKPHDPIILLRGATWADYQRVLELRGESGVPRVAFLEGVLQLMSPSRRHEAVKSMIGRLVEAWCFETGVDITPYGEWTLESKEAERGAEADECYVLGDEQDPKRPDIAIEVIVTSGGIDKLDIYRKLGVQEVWFWCEGQMELHALRGEHYDPIERSELLSGLDHELLLRFVDVKPMTKAVREYRSALKG